MKDAVPVAARVAAALGLPGSSPAAADAARSKERTRSMSHAAGLPTPRFAHLHESEDLERAAADVGFPAVIKPIFGAEADGVMRVNTFAELEAAYARVSRLIRPEHNPVYAQGSDLLLEEYLDGTEFDVAALLRWRVRTQRAVRIGVSRGVERCAVREVVGVQIIPTY